MFSFVFSQTKKKDILQPLLGTSFSGTAAVKAKKSKISNKAEINVIISPKSYT
jgi:hypothetical protein